MKLKTVVIIFISVLLGVFAGGYLFSNTQPRSFLMLNKCESRCFNTNEIVGLLASIGIQKAPHVIPGIVGETEYSIAFEHPFPQSAVHYVVVPKKDIKDISDIGNDEHIFITDAFNLMRIIIEREKLVEYKIVTNGPGVQQMG